MTVLGVTLSWAMTPTRCFRFADGFVGYVPGDRCINPECYGADGWPIDPETGARLEIYCHPKPEPKAGWLARFGWQ